MEMNVLYLLRILLEFSSAGTLKIGQLPLTYYVIDLNRLVELYQESFDLHKIFLVLSAVTN